MKTLADVCRELARAGSSTAREHQREGINTIAVNRVSTGGASEQRSKLASTGDVMIKSFSIYHWQITLSPESQLDQSHRHFSQPSCHRPVVVRIPNAHGFCCLDRLPWVLWRLFKSRILSLIVLRRQYNNKRLIGCSLL